MKSAWWAMLQILRLNAGRAGNRFAERSDVGSVRKTKHKQRRDAKCHDTQNVSSVTRFTPNGGETQAARKIVGPPNAPIRRRSSINSVSPAEDLRRRHASWRSRWSRGSSRSRPGPCSTGGTASRRRRLEEHRGGWALVPGPSRPWRPRRCTRTGPFRGRHSWCSPANNRRRREAQDEGFIDYTYYSSDIGGGIRAKIPRQFNRAPRGLKQRGAPLRAVSRRSRCFSEKVLSRLED